MSHPLAECFLIAVEKKGNRWFYSLGVIYGNDDEPECTCFDQIGYKSNAKAFEAANEDAYRQLATTQLDKVLGDWRDSRLISNEEIRLAERELWQL
jgi:hypothetical protein